MYLFLGLIIYNGEISFVIRLLYLAIPSKSLLGLVFELIDRGKSDDERSLILIENGHYAGYGYMDKTESFSSIEECRGSIKKANFYPDADDLIRGFLKNNKLKTLVFQLSDSIN